MTSSLCGILMPQAKGGMIEFKAGDGKAQGYLSVPKTSRGGVLVLHAWWGLNEFFKGLCNQLADDGSRDQSTPIADPAPVLTC